MASIKKEFTYRPKTLFLIIGTFFYVSITILFYYYTRKTYWGMALFIIAGFQTFEILFKLITLKKFDHRIFVHEESFEFPISKWNSRVMKIDFSQIKNISSKNMNAGFSIHIEGKKYYFHKSFFGGKADSNEEYYTFLEIIREKIKKTGELPKN